MNRHNQNSKSVFYLCLLSTLLIDNVSAVQSQDVDRAGLQDRQIIPLSIFPAKESVPALKHRLYPARRDMVKRNAAIYYHRAIKIADRLPNQPDFGEGASEDSYSMMFDSPLSELPLAPIKAWIAAHEQTIRELSRAERSSECDWGLMPDLDATSWFETLLPELQEMRELARMLRAKTRVEIAEGRLADAINTSRMNYKIVTDLSKSEVLIGDLIGIAIAGIANRGLYELIQQPDLPSLYWPLVAMPTSMVDTRLAILRELEVIEKGSGFQILDDPEFRQFSTRQWQEKYFADALRMASLTSSNIDKKLVEFGASVFLLQCYPIAKKALLDSGMSAEKVEAMPVIQVVAIHQVRQNRRYHDEMAKVVNLSLNEAAKRIEPSLDVSSMVGAARDGLLPYLNVLLPACQQVMTAQARIENRMAALKVIESIRLHLAATGQLPEKLTDITVVPVPQNPSMGEPFQYKKTENGATLVEKTTLRNTWHIYDITIGKKSRSGTSE